VRVFLDTNVLVSAFATRGLCADLFSEVLTNHDLLVGEVVLEELARVLEKKFRVTQQYRDEFFTFLREFEIVPRPGTVPSIKIRDPNDAWILASTLEGNAEVLVSGDPDLLALEPIKTLQILSPRAFWDKIRSGT
jgi:uncharacterized protein